MFEIIKIVVTLGVPGLALYIMYLLFKKFGFEFERISPVWSAILALVFMIIVGFIVYTAITKFDTPTPSQVSHMGELKNLITQVNLDPNATVGLKLVGTVESQTALNRLFIDEVRAPTYKDLINKLCLAHESCIKCTEVQTMPVVKFEIEAVKSILPNCSHDGATVYCCA